jgi:poly(3-hydroxybutyrate) depolymerase
MRVVLFTLALAAALTTGSPAMSQTVLSNPEARSADVSVRLAAALDRLSFRPDLPGVSGALALLEGQARLDGSGKARLEGLKQQIETSYRAGQISEALRAGYEAISFLRGGDWSVDAFPSSLTFDLEPVVDPATPLLVRVRGNWAETAPANAIVTLRLATFAEGAVVRELGRHALSNADLVARPQRFAVDLAGVSPGAYRLEGEIAVAGRTIGEIRAPVSLVADLAHTRAEFEKALAGIVGHDDAKATIRYPFSLAQELFAGTREVRSYDFTAGIERSRRLLAELQAGRDPIVRARGNIHRAYYMADADTIVPFRLYVPQSWDGKAKLPLMVFLHGANLDDDDSMERANGLLPRLAEQKGVILLAPLGYRMNSMYGAPVPGQFVTSNSPIAGIDARRAALSEKDVLNLTDLIAAEYDVDRGRIYLSGNSMGGMGTWHLAQKYPRRWAAIAPAAAGATDPEYDFTRLRGMPIMPVAGEHDFLRPMVEGTVAKARAAGLRPHYLMVPGGDHGTGVEIAMPAILDFFLKQRR